MRVETKHHPHHSELHLICETFREKKALRNIAKPGEQLIATVGGAQLADGHPKIAIRILYTPDAHAAAVAEFISAAFRKDRR